jgi:hypothetical protein
VPAVFKVNPIGDVLVTVVDVLLTLLAKLVGLPLQ